MICKSNLIRTLFQTFATFVALIALVALVAASIPTCISCCSCDSTCANATCCGASNDCCEGTCCNSSATSCCCTLAETSAASDTCECDCCCCCFYSYLTCDFIPPPTKPQLDDCESVPQLCRIHEVYPILPTRLSCEVPPPIIFSSLRLHAMLSVWLN